MAMKAKTELILYHCLWMADTMMRPSWRNMNSSFEGWAYRNGFLRQVHTLEAQGWLESGGGSDGTERVYRLTRKGMLRALGGSNPEDRWNRSWDGKWRMVVFDLPEEKRSLRNELRRELRAARFGGLQGSVWVSPDSVDMVGEQLKKTASSCGMITFFEGITCCGESNSEVVSTAWNFTKIKADYAKHLAHLQSMPTGGGRGVRQSLLDWGRIEKRLWAECMESDPLLPRELWPAGYTGETVWKKRIKILRQAGKLAEKSVTNT
jgi:phenylacetic acid degradation operon negative regulatory protein